MTGNGQDESEDWILIVICFSYPAQNGRQDPPFFVKGGSAVVRHSPSLS